MCICPNYRCVYCAVIYVYIYVLTLNPVGTCICIYYISKYIYICICVQMFTELAFILYVFTYLCSTCSTYHIYHIYVYCAAPWLLIHAYAHVEQHILFICLTCVGERERESVCVCCLLAHHIRVLCICFMCVCERERESICVCVCERESMCVCV